jgi:hypothetical protein
MPEFLPAANTFTVGGQSTISGYIVINEVDGFVEDGESKTTALGQHYCDITYSRRKTKVVTLELAHGTTQTPYMKGGHVDATFGDLGTAAWEIRNVSKQNTRGATQLTLDLISITEDITAPA